MKLVELRDSIRMRVFVYNLMFNKIGAVAKVCQEIGAEIVNISNDDIHKSIEHLVDSNKPSKAGKDCEENISELLIFDGFTNDNLDDFLDAYKGTQAPPVAFKAMVTPVNLKWTPAYLYFHLKSEMGI